MAEEPPSVPSTTRDRHGLLIRVALVAGLALTVLVTLFLVTSAVLKLLMGVLTGEFLVMLFVTVIHWRFVGLLACILVLRLGFYLVRRLDEDGGRLRHKTRTVVVATSAFFFLKELGCPLVGTPGYAPNRFGYYTQTRPNIDRVIRHENPSVPAAHVRSNAFGYRDAPWDLKTPAHRVLLVGDSFVWGVGIREMSGTLDACIERELNSPPGASRRGDARPWVVYNLGVKPSGLPYYVDALLEIGRVVKPEALIISYLGLTDDHLLDVPMLLKGRSGWLVRLLDRFGVARDLMWHNAFGASRTVERRLFLGRGRRRMRERFRSLVAFIEKRGIPLLIWEHRQHDPLFDPFREHPQIVFLHWWMTGHAKPKGGLKTSLDGWLSMPGYFVPNDGHPTERTNRELAKVIARALRKARGRRASRSSRSPAAP